MAQPRQMETLADRIPGGDVNELTVPDPGPEATNGEIRVALKNAQLEILQLKQEYKVLKRHTDTLDAAQVKHKKRRTRVYIEQPEDDEVVKDGKLFACMHEVWIDDIDIKTPPDPNGDADVYSTSRYRTAGSREDAIRREIRLVVPANLHEEMKDSDTRSEHFVNRFQAGMEATRTCMAHRIRHETLTIFGDVVVNNKDTWLRFDPHGPYPLLPPIVYPDGKLDNKNVFFAEPLIRIVLCMLRGSSALAAEKNGKAFPSHTFAKLWGVSAVTPGVIAFAAVLARWALSPDAEFTMENEWGDNDPRKFSYRVAFQEYKHLIIKNISKGTIKKLFETYNRRVFPEVLLRVDQMRFVDEDSGFQDAMNTLEEESDVDDSESGGKHLGTMNA